jgi:hypothetical protein
MARGEIHTSSRKIPSPYGFRLLLFFTFVDLFSGCEMMINAINGYWDTAKQSFGVHAQEAFRC